MLDEVETAR